MLLLYLVIFVLLVIFSAFFSSAETALLSLNKIRLRHRAQKKDKKARLLRDILKIPDEFFSTILIGNNLVNIAAATISTIIFSKYVVQNENLVLVLSTFFTTIIILLFAEVIPKSYAFRFSDKLSYLYAYPIKFFHIFFFPLVKVISLISRFFFKDSTRGIEKKELTAAEIKHFLSTEIKLFRYNPAALRMVNEIIDIASKDVKTIMTHRPEIVALEEGASIEQLKELLLQKKISRVPIYKKNLDHITGVIHANRIFSALLKGDTGEGHLAELASKPFFISEYSSLNYVLHEFKSNKVGMAVVLDEYGTTIGVITLYDIFREILGEIDMGKGRLVKKLRKNVFQVKGSIPVEEVNSELELGLPEKKDYATLSGLFVFYYGKFPGKNATLKFDDVQLVVKKMGQRKIEEIIVMKEDR
jgi:CBS domain containing-hemolysin-like protein